MSLTRLEVPEDELQRRRAAWQPPTFAADPGYGYRRLYRKHVTQAELGCDFDFMSPSTFREVAPIA